MNRRRPLLALTLLLTCLAAAGAANPPLPAPVAQHATAFIEWIFEFQFTPEQRERYRQILNQTWNGSNQGAIDAVQSMARAHENLPNLPESDRNALRTRFRSEFTRLLRTASDPDSQWLLSVAASPVTNAPAANPLTGRWTNGRISSIQYRETYTGASAPTNGNSFAYEFHPDGTYSFTGLMQSVMYQCTTTMFSNETGRYFLSGDTVSLKPEKNPFKMTNNCAPSSNREAPGKLTERSYRFRIVEGANPELELTGTDGAAQRFMRSR